MTKFYTQTGDDGYTGLLGEGRATKYDPRIDAIGIVDEANSALGLARSLGKAPQTASIIITCQRDLYNIMTELAVLPENASRFRQLPGARVTWLEQIIDEITKQVPVPNEFIVPGDSHSSAALDFARTVVRRAERAIAYLYHQKLLENSEILRYLNRLSSLCFALELLENLASGNSQPTLAKT
jgi:cob(I)alamin adenosyltransferase